MREVEKNLENLTILRKDEHLDICQNKNVQSELSSGWEDLQLPHCALPEISLNDVDLSQKFLNHPLNAPLIISSMTGGSKRGEEINHLLAKFAEENKIAMGVGSQRVALEHRNLNLFKIRESAPNALLFANIGIVQFNYGLTNDDCQWLVDQLEANALILHANVLQEAIQEEGDRNFSNLFSKITALKSKIKIPLILKETGCGLDANTCRRAIEAGIDVLDIAGMGGTHWGFIEGLRSKKREELGKMFRNWGIPSKTAFENARKVVPKDFPLIASGGIRNGLDVAKAIYAGADLVGMALPFFKAANQGYDQLKEFYDLQCEALKIALLCTGCKSVSELQKLGNKK